MAKHTYRSIEIQKVTAAQVLSWIVTPVVVVALDVAKARVLVALANAAGEVARLLHFALPEQLPLLLERAREWQDAGRTVHLVLEPTGTYGDPILAAAHAAGLHVFRLSPKRVHDAAELFDGVPSKHDPKDAVLIARLHAQGLSRPWAPLPETRRALRALVAERELFAAPLEVALGRLEALLAGWWPELLTLAAVRERVSLLRWLAAYPDPALVRARPKEAAAALARESRQGFRPEVIESIVRSARHTQGVPMASGEPGLLRAVVEEVVRLRRACEDVEARLEARLARTPEHAPLRAMLGPTTTAVLLAKVGDPREFASSRALEKACGLNVKEHSSGVRQAFGVHLTKRGPGLVRKYLYLLALRAVQREPAVRAWYQRRGRYGAGVKVAAVVALMRKLIRAAWHVARGEPFAVEKLLDLRRLGLEATRGAEASAA